MAEWINAGKRFIKDKVLKSNDSVKVTTDMQKVIMLPRIPGVKTAVFTRRLTTYHMTFAPVGGLTQGRGKRIGIIWHEALMGRYDEDVHTSNSSSMRDEKEFVFWVDNCSAQNKNWTLFTVFSYLVNHKDYTCEKITMKYFEAGHTLMAADAFHKEIEDKMKRIGNVYDFSDFEKVIIARGHALKMNLSDFTDYKGKLSKAKGTNHHRLENVVVAEFRSGSEKLFWKDDMTSNEYKSANFLQKKFVKVMSKTNVFLAKKSPRGINGEKKKDILDKLCHLMADNRKTFWENIPTNN